MRLAGCGVFRTPCFLKHEGTVDPAGCQSPASRVQVGKEPKGKEPKGPPQCFLLGIIYFTKATQRAQTTDRQAGMEGRKL